MSNKVDSIIQDRFDFYFSEKHKNYLIGLCRYSIEPYQPVYFRGHEYTEMIDKDQPPVTNHFGDLVYLGSGSYGDISRPTSTTKIKNNETN